MNIRDLFFKYHAYFHFILQLTEVGVHIFCQSTFGASSDLPWPDGHRYHQIFLCLHIGLICVCMWHEPVTMVLCWHGTTSMLCGEKRPRKQTGSFSLLDLEKILQVKLIQSILFNFYFERIIILLILFTL